MTNIFYKVLHYHGNMKHDIFVINIGAMDGCTYDDLYRYTSRYGFKGLYVEPIGYMFDRLKTNIPPYNMFENSAVCDYDGTVEMVMVNKDAIEEGNIASYFCGMTSIYPPKNGLSYESNRNILETLTSKIEVPCLTFESLLKKHGIERFDVISIDVEGYDYNILKQIDLKKYRPSLIRIEWDSISEEEKTAAIKQYEENGYYYEINGSDLDAAPLELFEMFL